MTLIRFNHHESKETKNKINIKRLQIPRIPKNVSVDELDRYNVKLYSDQMIMLIKFSLINEPDGIYRYIHLSETEKDRLKYTVIKHGNNHYAIYYGTKHKKELGKGGFGSVKLVQDLDSGEWHALKVQRINQGITNELHHLKLFNQLILNTNHDYFTFNKFSNRKKLNQHYTLIKLGGMDLLEFDNLNLRLPPRLWLEIALNAANEIATFHNSNTLHRDIKTENFLFDFVNHQVQLIDFNFASETDNRGRHYSENLTGTLGYVARELVENGKQACHAFDKSIDIYAFGVTLANILMLIKEMDTNSIPLFHQITLFNCDDDEILTNPRLPCDDGLKKDILKLINRMLSSVPNERPAINDIIKFFEDCLKKCEYSFDAIFDTVLISIKDLKLISDDKQSMNNLISYCRKHHYVQLIDNHTNHNEDELAYYMHLLESKGLYVRDYILYGFGEINEVAKQISSEKAKDGYDYHYTYFDLTLHKKRVLEARQVDANKFNHAELQDLKKLHRICNDEGLYHLTNTLKKLGLFQSTDSEPSSESLSNEMVDEPNQNRKLF